MVIEPAVLGMIENDESVLEKHVLQKLAKMGQLNAYVHKGFWQCMDTMNEKKKLEDLYNSDNCPWKIWERE
jgi:glucose-1-phosphate cytidylyltransferase